jgi:hypothetical protein
MIDYDKAIDLKKRFGDKAKEVVLEIIDALEHYDDQTEKYLKDEFGLEYFSAELQNMDSDFRYWDKVLNNLNN